MWQCYLLYEDKGIEVFLINLWRVSWESNINQWWTCEKAPFQTWHYFLNLTSLCAILNLLRSLKMSSNIFQGKCLLKMRWSSNKLYINDELLLTPIHHKRRTEAFTWLSFSVGNYFFQSTIRLTCIIHFIGKE